jgi:outer membrane murein-binding lipoprotein Lpp
MTTDQLLKLLIGISGGAASILGTLLVLVWRLSGKWASIDELARQVKALVERIDAMADQLDSVRGWRREHQATSDAQEKRLERIEALI